MRKGSVNDATPDVQPPGGIKTIKGRKREEGDEEDVDELGGSETD